MAAPVLIGATVQDDEVQSFLDKILAHTADIRPVLDGPVDRSVTKFFQKQFDSEGAFGGEPWKPLSAVTMKLRDRRGHGRAGKSRVLQDTREMWGSFTKRSSPLGLRVLTQMTLTRGSRLEKAARMQYGWKTSKIFGRPRRMVKVVPPRRIVPQQLPAPVVRAWTGMIENYVLTGSLKELPL